MAYTGKFKGAEIDERLSHIGESDEAIATALASLNERLLATQSATATGLASLDERVLLFQPNVAMLQSVTNMPSGKNLLVAKMSGNGSLSFSSAPAPGTVIRIMVVNAGNASIVITVPNSGLYVNLGADTRTVDTGKVLQIIAMCDGEKIYIQ